MKQLTVCLLLLCLAGCGANANTELEKGNAFLARQDWDNAIACYTEAIRTMLGRTTTGATLIKRLAKRAKLTPTSPRPRNLNRINKICYAFLVMNR